jgi:hypothetical protein
MEYQGKYFFNQCISRHNKTCISEKNRRNTNLKKSKRRIKMKKWIYLFIILLIFSPFTASQAFAAQENTDVRASAHSEAEVKLLGDMQKLWVEHAWWTRSYIISNLAGLKDQSFVLERLLKNQTAIGDAIKPYYGNDAGNKLTELLKQHILIAGEIVEAAKKNDKANVEKLNKKWIRNADQIVAFLSSANPNWPKGELTNMFYIHLKLVTGVVNARLNEN